MSESGLSDYEYAAIIGHYNGLSSKEDELKTRGYSEAMLKHLKSKKTTLVESLNFRFTQKGIVYPYFSFVITTYMAYKKHGILPFSGCFIEQPAKIVEVFNLMDALSDEAKRKAELEQDRLNKNGRHRR